MAYDEVKGSTRASGMVEWPAPIVRTQDGVLTGENLLRRESGEPRVQAKILDGALHCRPAQQLGERVLVIALGKSAVRGRGTPPPRQQPLPSTGGDRQMRR
jgi:hypothetical protein